MNWYVVSAVTEVLKYNGTPEEKVTKSEVGGEVGESLIREKTPAWAPEEWFTLQKRERRAGESEA